MAKIKEGAEAQGEQNAEQKAVENIESTPQAAAADAVAAPPAEKKGSGKRKEDLGVPDGWSVAWVPFAVSPDEHARLTKVAKVRGVKLGKLLADVTAYGLTGYKEQFDADVAKYDAPDSEWQKKAKASGASTSKKTPEEQVKDVEEKIKKAQQQLEALKAKAAERAAAAAGGQG